MRSAGSGWNMKISTKAAALIIFAGLLPYCHGPALAGPYPGTLKDHGHTRSGDGGVLTNLPVTGRITGGSLAVSSATVATMTVTNMGVSSLTVSQGWTYKKPQLVYVSSLTISITTNTRTSNTSGILFPDGSYRTVTENVNSTQTYRAFRMDQAANWSTGSVRGGFYPFSAINDRFYSTYAVKVTSAPLSDKFVIVASTVENRPENLAQLNTSFGTDSWVYLGMFIYGDSLTSYAAGNANKILPFVKTGGFTVLTSSCAGRAAQLSFGWLFGTYPNTSAHAYDWGSPGFGGHSVYPRNVSKIDVIFNQGTVASGLFIIVDGTDLGIRYWSAPTGGLPLMQPLYGLSTEGGAFMDDGINSFAATNNLGTSVTGNAWLIGYFDDAY